MPAALRMSASSSVASDEVLRSQRVAVRQVDVDAGVVLREARHLTAVIDPHRQLGDPGRHDPLDLVLPDPQRVRMTRRKVAHVQHGRAERHGLSHLTLREEAIGDPALIQHLDRARVKAAGPGADEHVIGTPLDHRHIHLRQRQLRRQHHPCRTASGDHYFMLGHRHAPVASVDDNARMYRTPVRVVLVPNGAFYSTIRSLMKTPYLV